jgi:hypothetical protein
VLKARFGLALFASAALVACGTEKSAPESSTPSFQSSEDDLMGGFVNKAKALDAVGTVGFKNDDGSYEFICTATLIGPRTVLTAKHCVVVLDGPFFGMKYPDLIPFYYAVGAEAGAPSQIVEVIDAQVTEVAGGSLGIGLDVAVLNLAADVKDVTPLGYSKEALKAEGEGTKLVTVGYGTQDVYAYIAAQYGVNALDGKRRAGTSTQGPQSGKVYPLFNISLEEYVGFYTEAYGEEFLAEVLGPDWRAIIESWYNEAVLAEGWEGFFGGKKGDAHTAPGDSGGPTFRKATTAEGKSALEVVAITSWGMSDTDPTLGGVFSTFGTAEAQKLIADALNYQDPCEGISAKGQCNGAVATRCRDVWEGQRRKLELDCDSLLLACATDAEGYAACVDPSTGETGGGGKPDAVAPANAPTKREIRENIVKMANGELNAKTRQLNAKK